MSQKRESNPKIRGTGDAYSTASAASSTNSRAPLLNPDAKLEYNPLSDFKAQGAYTRTQLKILPKLEADSLRYNALDRSETFLTSDTVTLTDSKDPLAMVKEEISTNFALSSVCSEVICPTIPTSTSVRIEMDHMNPAVVLERLSFPTTCFEVVNTDITSTQLVDNVKNRRRSQIRKSGNPIVVTKIRESKLSIRDEIKKSRAKYSVKHVRSDRNQIYVCEQCGKSFSEKGNLKKHMVTHTGERPFRCGQCERSFRRKCNLLSHKIIHTGEKRYTCCQCGKSFNANCSLRKHMITHTGEKRYKCGQCDKSFNQKSYLKAHIIIHTGEKPYKYWECDKSFNHSSHLKTHLITHTGEKLYKCGQCDKSFNVKCSLRKHMAIHTGEKRYICSQCCKSFNFNVNLKTHMVTHTGEKRYTCWQCGMSFGTNSYLKIHMTTHTGEKRYRCGQCDKSFNQRSHLKIHMVTHTGERPYRCGQCDKSFRRKGNLISHDNSYRREAVHMLPVWQVIQEEY